MAASRFLLCCFLLAVPSAARAQAVPDTAVVLPGVTVTATRTETTTARAPVRVTVLGREAMETAGGRTVAELLDARSGAFVRSYGGGGLASLSLRGTGASQTLILLDGHRIADLQLGQLDLSLLPTLLLESVEVAHGAGSSLYGSDGIGGVVNLRTRAPGEGRTLRLLGGYGAYGERTGSVLVSSRRGALSGLVLASYETTEGDYPYVNAALFPPREVDRANADRALLSLFTALGYEGARHRLRLAGWYSDAERGLPGLATTPSHGERQWDEQLRLWASDDVRLAWGRLRLAGLLQHAALRYRDPALGLDETGRTTLGSLEAEVTAQTGARWLLAAGATGSYGRATHPSLAAGADEAQAGVFVHATGQYGPVLLYPAVRADVYASAGGRQGALSPRLGANVQVLDAVTLKASAGRAFRRPTFNDRYWQPGGNPALRPEHGWTYDAGVFVQQAPHQAELTVFAAATHDQIVWLPTKAGHYAPSNVRRTRTRGFEASYRWTQRLFSGALIYTFTDARDHSEPGAASYGEPLRYVPRTQVKASLGARLGALSLGLGGRWAGRRYVTTDGTQALDPYLVVDVQAGWVQPFAYGRARLTLAVENVLDRAYAVIQHYPMPPRHARLQLVVELGGAAAHSSD